MATFGKKPPPPVLTEEEKYLESIRLKEALRARILARLEEEQADSERAEQMRLALLLKK